MAMIWLRKKVEDGEIGTEELLALIETFDDSVVEDAFEGQMVEDGYFESEDVPEDDFGVEDEDDPLDEGKPGTGVFFG